MGGTNGKVKALVKIFAARNAKTDFVFHGAHDPFVCRRPEIAFYCTLKRECISLF